MHRRWLWPLLLIIIVWTICARAEEITVTPFSGGFEYSFQSEETFLVLSYQTDTESARCTLFSENGSFTGRIETLHTFAVSPLNVTVATLTGGELYTASAQTVAAEQPIPQQSLTQQTAAIKLSDVEITPLVGAVQYRFRAPGHTSLLMKYKSSAEEGTVTLYAGDGYLYEGILPLPYTYNNSNVALTVANRKDNRDLYETVLRTDYPVTQAPEQGSGRLNGITVCIDPGHQETAKTNTEELGPGLSGTKAAEIGMARGTVTQRMESIVTLEIGFALRDVLLAQGAAVVMTRETQDIYLTNKRRAAIAAEANADIFLRLHCNNRDQESVQGIGIYCPYGSAYARAIADRDGWQEMGEILLNAMKKSTGQQKGSAVTTNRYVGNNWALMPSFLIEMGYMSNPAEDVLLSAKPYQQRLAAGMANGIYSLALYLGLISP